MLSKSSFRRQAEDPKDITFGRLSLQFRDSLIERQFQQSYVTQMTTLNRGYMLVGLLAYVIYSVLDFLVLGADLQLVLWVRLAAVGILGGLIATTYWRHSYSDLQWILGACVLVSGGGIILMTAVMDPPFSYLYYAGLILIIIYASNLLILRYVYSALLSTALFAAYIATTLIFNPVPRTFLVSNIFFLFVTVAWTCWTAYWQEYFVRRAFLQRYLLRQEAKRAVRLSRVAEAGNRAKSEFLAVMSHELRTPLNAIIGFSEIMEQKLFGPLGDEKYEQYITDIATSGRHLLGIINDILDLSRAEAGKLEMKEDDADLVDVVDRAMRMMRDEAARKGVRLALVEPEEDILVWVDENLLRQVLVNLLSNAVKFTGRGGLVDVEISRAAHGGVVIEVRDTGVGIDARQLDTILEPFTQVESALARANGGVGLGLPLVKKIVELHEGKLRIDSTPGVGTTVSVILPPERWVEDGPVEAGSFKSAS